MLPLVTEFSIILPEFSLILPEFPRFFTPPHTPPVATPLETLVEVWSGIVVVVVIQPPRRAFQV